MTDPESLAALPVVQAARARVHELDAETLQEQLRLVAIPAPSLAEGERARYVADRFRALGLDAVREDQVGNVLGELPGTGPDAGDALVVAAHLDTVFPPGTDVTPRRSGQRHFAPGITDNARGLAALLAVARVLAASGIRTRRPVRFAATVGEEGLGDLRGAKHLFREGSPDRGSAFVSLDGSGLRRVVHRAIGSRRLRLSLSGPGGHSWADWGTANPAHALGEVIAGLSGLPLPAAPPATLTVARLGGGTSINAIPAEAWSEVDLRSEEPAVLERLEAHCRAALAAAADRENARRRSGTDPLSPCVVVIGDRPGGSTPPESPLVRAALAATRQIGAEPELAASSTDANVPMSLGIPAVTIGAGGESGGVHTLAEWYENRGGAAGVERALLLVLAAAGVGSAGSGR